jgi:hypothetical protein
MLSFYTPVIFVVKDDEDQPAGYFLRMENEK